MVIRHHLDLNMLNMSTVRFSWARSQFTISFRRFPAQEPAKIHPIERHEEALFGCKSWG